MTNFTAITSSKTHHLVIISSGYSVWLSYMMQQEQPQEQPLLFSSSPASMQLYAAGYHPSADDQISMLSLASSANGEARRSRSSPSRSSLFLSQIQHRRAAGSPQEAASIHAILHPRISRCAPPEAVYLPSLNPACIPACSAGAATAEASA